MDAAQSAFCIYLQKESIMDAIIAKFAPIVVGAIAILGGIIFGWMKGKSAKTTVAQANEKVAAQQAATAVANAAASEHATQAMQARVEADAAAAKVPDNQLDDALKAIGALATDKGEAK